jgi:hypothetical protein
MVDALVPNSELLLGAGCDLPSVASKDPRCRKPVSCDLVHRWRKHRSDGCDRYAEQANTNYWR